MSKEMPLKVFAKKIGIDKKEQEWIEKNDKDTHYYNNSALKNSWLSLSYPIYDGDYYFAFIHDKVRVNAQYNAKANRELNSYKTSFLSADEIFDKMEKYFAMQFKSAGAGDTMTREELWTAIVDMRKKNPAPKREGVNEGMTMKQIMRKHGRHLKKAEKTGNLELPSKAEQDLQQWVFDNEPDIGDDPDDFDDWLDSNLEDIIKGKIKEDVSANLMDTYRHSSIETNFDDIESRLHEVTDKEINAVKKLSKDLQKVKTDYFKIAKIGDKTLKNVGFNKKYESILKAQQEILSLIGELSNMKMMSDRNASQKKDSKGRPIMNDMNEEKITYKVKGMQTPERQKFRQSAKMMKVQLDIIDSDRQTNKVKKGETVLIVTGTKKKLRDFDSVVRGKSSYGDPSTIKHFDEK